MLLPFTAGLTKTTKFDAECAALADRHYSRRKHGSPQFMPPGRTLVLRDSAGACVFAWVWQRPEFRDDHQLGYNCSIFRNESPRLSSEIILEAEQLAFAEWGLHRVFTYVDSRRIRSTNPGCCFKAAGWELVGRTASGKHLLAKGRDDFPCYGQDGRCWRCGEPGDAAPENPGTIVALCGNCLPISLNAP